jgi:hypothetical protein
LKTLNIIEPFIPSSLKTKTGKSARNSENKNEFGKIDHDTLNKRKGSEIVLNLINENTVIIHGHSGENRYASKLLILYSKRSESSKHAKVVKDIGDIHEFYQHRILTDYKNETEGLREVCV